MTTLSPAARGGIIIATLPAAGRPIEEGLLHLMVADAARQVLDHADHVVLAAGGENDAAGAAEPPASVDDGVIAAHERRISILRERMAALCSAGGTAPMLDALRNRLRRAEAAHGLALARVGAEGAVAADVERCAARRGVLVAVVSVRYGPAASAPRQREERHGRTALVAWHAGAHRRPIQVAFARRSAFRSSGGTMAARYVTGGSTVRYGRADAAAISRLARARRSLAAARRALQGPASPLPGRVLAGLWRWEGSDTWRLLPDRATTS